MCWEDVSTPLPELDFLKNWAYHTWLLRGRLNLVVLGRGLMLFEFQLLSQAERVLAKGKRRVKDNVLFLEKWYPKVGCFCNGANANKDWVRVVGLPLHLWNCEVFKLIGDGCGGFFAVDENTNSMAELQWARSLVKLVGRDLTHLCSDCGWVGEFLNPFVVGNPALVFSGGTGRKTSRGGCFNG